jgi:hypothetical protein
MKLLRDTISKAIINNDDTEYERIMRERRQAESVQELKEEIKDLKEIVYKLVNER